MLCARCSAKFSFISDANDSAGVLMKVVEAQFVVHVKKHEGTARETKCQPENVDDRVDFLLEKIPEGDFEIVFEHGFSSEQLAARSLSYAILFSLPWLHPSLPDCKLLTDNY